VDEKADHAGSWVIVTSCLFGFVGTGSIFWLFYALLIKMSMVAAQPPAVLLAICSPSFFVIKYSIGDDRDIIAPISKIEVSILKICLLYMRVGTVLAGIALFLWVGNSFIDVFKEVSRSASAGTWIIIVLLIMVLLKK
jgi:hypothetical protein